MGIKTAGIIGGMGPGTTADFYKDINAIAEDRNLPTRPGLFIWNVPLEYAIEQDLLQNQEGLEKYLPYLVEAAQRLEAAGCDFLVVPCNTVHELYDQFSSEVRIPILHIVNETVKALEKQSIGQVALLATEQTIGSRLYQEPLDRSGIDWVIPSNTDQKRLNDIVSRLVTASGADSAQGETSDKKWLNGLVDGYVRDIGSVVLGCTDFHILLDRTERPEIVDSMHTLAIATVDHMTGELSFT
jgi:aspartate racemase